MSGRRPPRDGETDPAAVTRAAWREARLSQPGWSATPVRRRLGVVRRTRRLLAGRGAELAAAIDHPQRRSKAESLSAEVLPLADACRFLERRAPDLLRPRRLAGWGPLWLGGTRLEERRDPVGLVLVIGPGNYPLFLPGVQVIQAMVAGNSVLWKPGVGGAAVARELLELMVEAGLPGGVVTVLPEETKAARTAIEAGVDKVVFTGSADAGRIVLGDLARRLTPAAMELSGCDAVFVRRDADLALTARALAFGLALNGGATCMAPRRVFVDEEVVSELERELRGRVAGLEPVDLPVGAARRAEAVIRDALDRGARWVAGSLPLDGRMRPVVLSDAGPEMDLFAADLMAPVLALSPVRDDEQALVAAARCPFALGAAVFSRRGANELAARVSAGVVVINDLIAPTADPRLAFGGRGESGYGRTRGAAGLLELTHPKTVVRRRSGLRPHLRPPGGGDEAVLSGLLRILHGGPRQWSAGCRELMSARGEASKETEEGGRVPKPERPAKEGVVR